MRSRSSYINKSTTYIKYYIYILVITYLYSSQEWSSVYVFPTFPAVHCTVNLSTDGENELQQPRSVDSFNPKSNNLTLIYMLDNVVTTSEC